MRNVLQMDNCHVESEFNGHMGDGIAKQTHLQVAALGVLLKAVAI